MKKETTKNGIIIALAVALVAVVALFSLKSNQYTEHIVSLNTKVDTVESVKDQISASYDAAMVRLDSLTGQNTKLKNLANSNSSTIGKLRFKISELLKQNRMSKEQADSAEAMIKQLNFLVDSLRTETFKLKEENKKLDSNFKATKAVLTSKIDSTDSVSKVLKSVVEVASTLNATGLSVSAFKENRRGDVETVSARKADKIVVSFFVENRVAESGKTNVYVSIVGPDGSAFETGKISLRNGSDVPYTSVVPVEYETGKKVPVSFSFTSQKKLKKGQYTVTVYHNGFEIGSSQVTLSNRVLDFLFH